MNRRQFLQSSAALPILAAGNPATALDLMQNQAASVRRVRPSDAAWPSATEWDKLKNEVHNRLIKVESPLAACRTAPGSAACAEVFKELKNPFYIGDQPALTQTTGWVDAWTSSPSVYAVAAAEPADVVAAVNFARRHNLRLVVKGGAHSYQGTSSSADSLLIWTRAMKDIILHDAFIPVGCIKTLAPEPAVTVQAGCMWRQVYEAVTTQAGRYVQGGGCTTVGVAGLIQSGGCGSFSKNYGLAAAGLLEAEIVTADGVVRIANACTHPDLFWALKGGGGGSLGVVTRLTLRTRDLPETFGRVTGAIQAKSDAAYRKLLARLVEFYKEQLFNRHWGEQLALELGNLTTMNLSFQGLSKQQVEELWRPLLEWIAASHQDYGWVKPFQVDAVPARHYWDGKYLQQHYPSHVIADDRMNAARGDYFWTGNLGEAGHYLHGFRSAWLPGSLLKQDQQSKLVDALFAGTRHWGITLHFNKGLGGAPAPEVAAARDTATNPAVLDAFGLAIIAGNSAPAFPGIVGHEPDLSAARRDARTINKAMEELLKVVTQPGSYISESDYFEQDWQRSFWGTNYPRLMEVKKKYDPDGLFFVHHGVGSEGWSEDGFSKS